MGAFDDLIPGGAGGAAKPPTAGQAAQIQQRQNNLNALANSYATVKGRYERDLKGVGPGSLLEYLPLPRNKAFDSAAAGLSDLALAAFRVPGVGAQSDRELAAFVAANQPKASDSDAEIEAKLANIRNRIQSSGVPIPGEAQQAPAASGAGFKIIGRRPR